MPCRVLESPARALAKRLRAWEVMKLRLLTLKYLQPREMSQPTELAASPLAPRSPSGSAAPRDPQTAVGQTDVSCQELGGAWGFAPTLGYSPGEETESHGLKEVVKSVLESLGACALSQRLPLQQQVIM